MPGARHDAAPIGLIGWADTPTGANWVADGVYSATGVITTWKKASHRDLAKSQKAFSVQVSEMRSIIHMCFAHLKSQLIIVTGYQRQLSRLLFVIALVATLVLYRLGW